MTLFLKVTFCDVADKTSAYLWGTTQFCLGDSEGQGPKPHPHDSTLGESSREAQSGRRLLGTNGVSSVIMVSVCLPSDAL